MLEDDEKKPLKWKTTVICLLLIAVHCPLSVSNFLLNDDIAVMCSVQIKMLVISRF